MSAPAVQKQGVAFALSAYVMWGFAPIYFKLIDHVGALEILVNRIAWSSVFLLLIILVLRQWKQVKAILYNPKMLMTLAVSAVLLGFNWGVYIWAVNNNHLLDASLGYYINPLLNVLLARIFLGEKLSRNQNIAIALAFTGVLIQLVSFGSFPAISFILAGTFAFYGLMRKMAPVDAVAGLFFESLLLLPIALIYWNIYLESNTVNLLNNSSNLNLLLLLAGVVTTLPLLSFIAGARRLQFTTISFFQYLAPTIGFLLAVYVFGETVGNDRWVSFGFIWGALLIFSVDALIHIRKQGRKKKPA